MTVIRAALFSSIVFAAGACTPKDSGTADTAAPGVAPATESTTGLPATAGAEPTANEISNYRLDMDKVRRFVAAMKGFSTLSSRDSAAAAAMGSSSSNESSAQMIARIEGNPVAVRVLRDAGLSPKEYVWITAAWLQAAMTQGILEASPEAKLPEGQNPQNVQFLNANKAELERMMKDAGMKQ